MKYRVDAPTASSVPQAHLAIPNTDAELLYAADVGLPQGTGGLNDGSVVVMAGMPHWPTAPESDQLATEPIRSAGPSQNQLGARDAHGDSRQERGSRVGSKSTASAVPQADQADEEINTVDEQKTESAQTSVFRPVWEVDQLSWPQACEELYASEIDYFRHAGGKLVEASRQGLRVLAVTSSRQDSGCTTLAMCLARAVTATGARVALLDCNVEHPAMGETLGLEFPHGWQDAIAHKMPLGEVAVASISDGITLFPLGDLAGPLEPSRVSEMLRQAAQCADLLILDAGPLDTGEGCLFESGRACPISAAIVVRDLRTTTEQSTLATAASLKNLGIEAVGIAENYAPQSVDAAA